MKKSINKLFVFQNNFSVKSRLKGALSQKNVFVDSSNAGVTWTNQSKVILITSCAAREVTLVVITTGTESDPRGDPILLYSGWPTAHRYWSCQRLCFSWHCPFKEVIFIKLKSMLFTSIASYNSFLLPTKVYHIVFSFFCAIFSTKIYLTLDCLKAP